MTKFAAAALLAASASADLVAEINSIPGIKWTAGPDKRFGGDLDKAREQCGAKSMSREEAIRAGTVREGLRLATIELPEAFDAATNVTPLL